MGQPPISYCCFFLFQDADQYKYGKNRVEADAKRLQTKEGELLKSREALRSQLAQLRRERRDLKAAIEVNAGKGLLSANRPVAPRAPVLDCVTLRSLEALLLARSGARVDRQEEARADPQPAHRGRKAWEAALPSGVTAKTSEDKPCSLGLRVPRQCA